MKTFDILSEFRALEELLNIEPEINPETGEITSDAESELKAYIDSLNQERDIKLNNIERLKREKKAGIEALKQEIDRLGKRVKQEQNSIDSLTNLQFYLTNGNKIDTGLYKFGTRKSTSLKVIDENSIPKEWFKEEIIRKLDKRELLKYAKEHSVDGVEVVKKVSLSVR